MQPGKDIFSQLQGALRGVRRDENQLSAALHSATQEVARLHAEEMSAYRRLAHIRLESLAREGVAARLSSAERRALDLLERRKQQARRDAETHERLVAETDSLTRAHAAALERVEEAAEATDKLRATTMQRLAGDAQWKSLGDAIRQAEAVASAGKDKADRSANEQAEKGKPYEDDALFMYLYKRRFGTSDYKAGYIARFFDGWVAHMIGYDELRPNYFMLNEIPARLREHAERLAQTVQDKAQARKDYERAALVADGIEALEKALSDRDAEADAIGADLHKAEAELKALETETAEAAKREDPELRQALTDISEALAQDDISDLYHRALQTRTPEDEDIVSNLQAIRRSIETAQREVEETRRAIIDIERKRADLERSSDRFQRRGYQDPFGGFSNADIIGEVIGGILRGALRGRDLDKTLDDGFRRQRPRAPGGFGGGIRFPDGEAWPRGKRMGHGWDDGGLLDRKDDWFGGGDSGDWGDSGGSNDGFGGGGGFRTGGGF